MTSQIKFRPPPGRPPAILVLARPDYRHAPTRQKKWSEQRPRHIRLLEFLQQCRVRSPVRVTIAGKPHTGGWARDRDMLQIMNLKSNAELQPYLDDLVDPIWAIEIEPYKVKGRKGPGRIVWLLPLPAWTEDTAAQDYRELPYDTSDPRTGAADILLAYWQRRYQEVHRRAYESTEESREWAAFRSYVKSVVGGAEDEPRIRVLIDAFLDGRITFKGKALKIDLTRSPKYRQHGPTLLTLVKVAVSLGRQVEKAVTDRAGELGVKIPRWALRTNGEKEREVRQHLRGYAYGKGARPGQPLLLRKHRPPLELINRWRKDAGLLLVKSDEYGQGLLDDDEVSSDDD